MATAIGGGATPAATSTPGTGAAALKKHKPPEHYSAVEHDKAKNAPKAGKGTHQQPTINDGDDGGGE